MSVARGRSYGVNATLLAAVGLAVGLAGTAQGGPSAQCFGREVGLFGSPDPDAIAGTPGGDVIATFEGADQALGDPSAPGGRDHICLGRGDNFGTDGTGDRDHIAGANGSDGFAGGAGDDVLRGGPAPDFIDTVADPGRNGADDVRSGGGGDKVDEFGDGKKDEIDCGPGEDQAFVDRRDLIRRCETVFHEPS